MRDIRRWLESLGLGEYSRVFEENAVDFRALPSLTEDDLKELGLKLGHRRILQQAIAELDTEPEPIAPNDPLAAGEAERRQLTVLFCDLVGSTELSQRLDPEDLRDVIAAYQDACKAGIERYDGYIARYMGDGVLAYFGYPRAHEDAVERAILSGLAVTHAVSELQLASTAGAGFEARAGIATGPVVVGDLIGEGASQESAVVGETPNLAARLQSEAKPGDVVVSELTHRLAHRLFDYEDLGERALKGIKNPVKLWRVAGELATTNRFHATRSAGLMPMVGRREELEMLARRWHRAQNGDGQLALIVGEPGIGKSRLVEALRADVSQDKHVWLGYQCSPHHASSSFYPLIAQMRRAMALEDGGDPLHRLEKLLARGGGHLDQDVPLIAALMSIATDDRYPAVDIEPRERKARIIEAFTRQFEGLTRDAPVLCVFEDVHWMDPSTIEVVDELSQRLDNRRALLVLTHRPEFDAPWIGQPYSTLIALNRMDRNDSRRMVESVMRRTAVSDKFIDEITRRADGIPLFLEELAHSVVQSTDMDERRSEGLTDHNGRRRGEIPETLQDSLRARLDRVPSEARELAELAAVIGRDFDYSLLQMASSLPATEARAALDHLIDAGLVQLRGIPPNATGRFKHALIRDAAYEGLIRSRRRTLHANVARAMDTDSRPEATREPEVIAEHFTEAGLSLKAIPYWLEATTRATERSAHREANDLARRGLGLLPDCPPGVERDRIDLRLQFSLALALRSLQGMNSQETLSAFERAADLSRELGDSERQLECLRGIFN